MGENAMRPCGRGPAVCAALGRAVGALGLVLGAALSAPPAHAAGLYFSERGVRPLARGGAFVAGADDLGAIYYNPAGIYDAGGQFLVDASWLHFTTDYTRKGIVEQSDPNTGQVVARWTKTYPSVEGVTPVLPLPTLAASYRVHPDWVVALGLDAPYGAIPSYPDKVNGQPAPQRYGLLTLDGSLLSVVGLWAAWAPSEQWRVGLGFEALIGRFVATTVLSGCLPDRFLCAYEQPSWDTLAQVVAGPIIAPSANAGVKWIPDPSWRLGLALQLPYWVRAPGTMNVRLPATPVFERASLEGVDARINFETPLGLRAGVEWRPVDELNLELAGSYEAWSMHDTIEVVPDGMALRRVAGLPDPYLLPTVDFPRNFQDTGSVRLGAEYHLDLFDYIWEIRGGVSFESSAVPTESL
jgi:long-chain fatty acid transport protein